MATSYGSTFDYPSSPISSTASPASSRAPGRSTTAGNGTKSPFFAPRPQSGRTPVDEHKSTVLGCTANLFNAIIGSGIVGIPFAIRECGFYTGVALILLVAMLTEKSLRLLIETAKFIQAPSYETLCEAAFGKFGFLFVTFNMFVMSYGAMISYLMIVKDSFGHLLDLQDDPNAKALQNRLLFWISILIMFPLSSQRDMADLAKTSRINVVMDTLMVGFVCYNAIGKLHVEFQQDIDQDWSSHIQIVHWQTVFVGLGVLSFAFVCQHSAFIIAGSLEQPTRQRWSRATSVALTAAALLMLCCGMIGYLGYRMDTQGNVLNNLPPSNLTAQMARAFLGCTMLFVYPLEAFVARHVCVVLLFQGRRAHEGEDASVLNRRDRRLTLTLALYILAVVPSMLFDDLGQVLALSGTVGGSCLSYIGPGVCYLGVHGATFLELAEEHALFQGPLGGFFWLITGMPIWSWIARIGSRGVVRHRQEMALKSPHPSRIGEVAMQQQQLQVPGRVHSFDEEHQQQPTEGRFLLTKEHVHAPRSSATNKSPQKSTLIPPASASRSGQPPSVNQTIGEFLMANQQKTAAEQKKKQQGNSRISAALDPPQDPPKWIDFVIAIGYFLFGIMAFVVGLVSLVLD